MFDRVGKEYDCLNPNLLPDLDSMEELMRDEQIPIELENALDEAHPDYLDQFDEE